MKKIIKDCFGGLAMTITLQLIVLVSCTKETPVNCGHVYQMKKVYNNTTEWKYIKTELVFDFGIMCGDDLKFYQAMVKDTTQLCFEPVMLFWIIKN